MMEVGREVDVHVVELDLQGNGDYAAAGCPLLAARYSLKGIGTLLSLIRAQSTVCALAPLSDVMTFAANSAERSAGGERQRTHSSLFRLVEQSNQSHS